MRDILSRVDHTLLSPVATWEQIKELAEEAMANSVASVCVPPCYVEKLRESFTDLTICTVVGFPLGYSSKETKAFEAKEAIEKGADEIDMVINIAMVKNQDFDGIKEELGLLRKVCGNKILKVIVETYYLTQEEKNKLCDLVYESGADFIKTSTGFAKEGAKLEDIRLFKERHPNLKAKAAGGIGSIEEAIDFIEAGADRLGSSRLIKLVEEVEHAQ